MNAPGIGERLLALEAAVAALQASLREIMGAGEPSPTSDPSGKTASSGKGQASGKPDSSRKGQKG